jgi:hypothetical protein
MQPHSWDSGYTKLRYNAPRNLAIWLGKLASAAIVSTWFPNSIGMDDGYASPIGTREGQATIRELTAWGELDFSALIANVMTTGHWPPNRLSPV